MRIIAIGNGRPNAVFSSKEECQKALDISPSELFQAMKHGYEFKGYYFDELFDSEKEYMDKKMKENKK